MVKYSIVKVVFSDNSALALSVKNAISRNSNATNETILILDNDIVHQLGDLVSPVSKAVLVKEPSLIKQNEVKVADEPKHLLLTLINTWSSETVPFLPEFKKQVGICWSMKLLSNVK